MSTQAEKYRESARIGEIRGLLEQIQTQLARKGRDVAKHRLDNWHKIRSIANQHIAEITLKPVEPDNENTLPMQIEGQE